MLLRMSDDLDPRERAFAALVPLAPTVAKVLAQVDVRVADDTVRNAAARASWTSTQRKTCAGYSRFCWATDGLKAGLHLINNVSYISILSQERSNLFLWQVDAWLTVRVKSEPSELAYEATEPLFPRDSTVADQTVCLSWDITMSHTIRDARFVSVHDCMPWSITLAELLGAFGDSGPPRGGTTVTPLKPRRPGGPGVRSNRPRRSADDDADTPQPD